MNYIRSLFLIGGILLHLFSYAQVNLRIVTSSTLNSAPAIHSGVFTEYKGKWIFIGGRKNGLHGFHPPFAFPSSGINDRIWVVDPISNQSWYAGVDSLNTNLREAITSSNMQFYREGSKLYMVGGYGWQDSIQDFITFPTLTEVDLTGLLDVVLNNKNIAPYFTMIKDQRIAICGAHLQKIDSVYYLVFGHRFDGRYNRENTGFFVQKYSNEIRKFTISGTGNSLEIKNYSTVKDTVNFHRRDYNLIPQIYPNGEKALTAFSGVFRYDANLPYLTCIDITKNNYTHQSSFNQNLSQYHSAVAALIDTVTDVQHNIFFGGMSMYVLDSVNGNNIYDSLVPFVNTVSDVVRQSNNTYQEYSLSVRMPGLLGTNAYFMPAPGINLINEEVIVMNGLKDSTLLGYIVGGIESPEKNISVTDPAQSFARQQPLEVYYMQGGTGVIKKIVNDVLNFRAFHTAANSQINFQFELPKNTTVKLSVFTSNGKKVKELSNTSLSTGKHQLGFSASDLAAGIYFAGIEAGEHIKFCKLVIK